MLKYPSRFRIKVGGESAPFAEFILWQIRRRSSWLEFAFLVFSIRRRVGP